MSAKTLSNAKEKKSLRACKIDSLKERKKCPFKIFKLIFLFASHTINTNKIINVICLLYKIEIIKFIKFGDANARLILGTVAIVILEVVMVVVDTATVMVDQAAAVQAAVAEVFVQVPMAAIAEVVWVTEGHRE